MRCNALTKNGTQCKNTTTERFPYCWIHLKSKHSVVVKTSTIPRAGKGLFYVGKKDFPKDKNIIKYSGTVSKTPDPESKYVIEMAKNKYLDAKNKLSAVGRYINHSTKPNVIFSGAHTTQPYYGQHSINVRAKKRIKPNTELFANYGKQYWK